MMKTFFEFFARRTLLANLISIMIVLLGIGSLLTIKRDSYPHVDFGEVLIETSYPGASPEDVEINITNKIENELKSVTGIKNFTSVSIEGVSLITVIIDPTVRDMKKVKNDVRDAVNRIKDWPREIENFPFIEESNSATFPIMEVALSGEMPYRDLYQTAKLLKKKLENLPEVCRINEYGYRAREIHIELAPEKIKDYQIPINCIKTAIQKRNIRSTAGNSESLTDNKNITISSQFSSPSEVGDVIIRNSYDGPLIRLHDLAVIEDDFEKAQTLSRVNGISSISFEIIKAESADILRAVESVKKVIKESKEITSAGLKISIANDSSHYVRNRLNIVQRNAVLGLIFVILLLRIFMNAETSFWIAAGIPISLLGTIYLMPFFNVFLDSLSLSAMIMVIGIIVDDAIIISENIYKHREQGSPPLKATISGIQEIFWPVLTTVLTTFFAFVPMFFMEGLFGKFVTVIPLVITLALFISLIESFIALPAHLQHGLRKHRGARHSKNKLQYLKAVYFSRMKQILKFRYMVVFIFIIVFGVTLHFGLTRLKTILFPDKMAEEISITAQLPQGSSLQHTSQKFSEIEQIIARLPKTELSSFVTRIGEDEFSDIKIKNHGYMILFLTPFSERKRSAQEIVEELRKSTRQLKGFENISYFIETGGPPDGKPVEICIVGSNDTIRKKLADDVVSFLNTLKGVKDITRDDKIEQGLIELDIDYLQLERFGLTVENIASNARIAYEGEVVTKVRYGDEDVNFRLLFNKNSDDNPDRLENLLLANNQNKLIELNKVAKFKHTKGQSLYQHHNGQRAVKIEADVFQDIMTPDDVMDLVENKFNLDRDYPGTKFIKEGEIFETEQSFKSLFLTMIIALTGIYFLLIVLFNSLTQPLIVMAAIPFGIFGVILAFLLHKEPLSFIALLGAIGLTGVVVNDSLVLVSHLNQIKKSSPAGLSIIDIVAQGSSDRLRAIIMTTVTTVGGLIPLAYGWGGSDPFMAPMALSMSYGLLIGTPLTLLITPCLYLMLHNLSEKTKIRIRQKRQRILTKRKNRRMLSLLLVVFIGLFTISTESNSSESPLTINNTSTEGENKKILSFDSYIKIVTDKLPELKKNRIAVERSRNSVYAASAVDDLSFHGEFKYNENDEYSDEYPAQSSRVNGYTANMAMRRTISKSGSRIAAGIEYANSSDASVDNGRRYHTPTVFVQITQPILKNIFGMADRFAKNDAQMQLAIDEIRRKESDESDMSYYQKLYFNWITCYKHLHYLKQCMTNAEKLLADTKEKLSSGLVDNDELQEAEASLLLYQEQYHEEEIIHNAILSELDIFFDTNKYLPQLHEFEKQFEQLLSFHYEFVPFTDTSASEIYALMNKKLNNSRKVYANNLLPEINLVGQYSNKSTDHNFSNALDNMQDEDYYIGLNVTIPWENRKAKSALKNILLDIDDLKIDYDLSKNEYLKSLKNLQRLIKGKKRILQVKENLLKSLESKYNTEKKKLMHARLDLRHIIDTENEIASEQIEIINIKNEIIVLNIDYSNLTN